ncbi:hypothetical protein IE81DRAFT_168323 [Ceraceosorus guamensis]|uniref:Uncharacterized protein n=1 Tax=Ceraceosorus guamensis TaxID=1522189 RepID=A0A316VVC7_9BASI|nr:hypothetical protein IE81DRAFT_168323 [Ceraceosorus guamensis]PWN41586.1 hypothetical protein IE81DRAFT_168323 [Ceraceosorus guamensis]
MLHVYLLQSDGHANLDLGSGTAIPIDEVPLHFHSRERPHLEQRRCNPRQDFGSLVCIIYTQDCLRHRWKWPSFSARDWTLAAWSKRLSVCKSHERLQAQQAPRTHIADVNVIDGKATTSWCSAIQRLPVSFELTATRAAALLLLPNFVGTRDKIGAHQVAFWEISSFRCADLRSGLAQSCQAVTSLLSHERASTGVFRSVAQLHKCASTMGGRSAFALRLTDEIDRTCSKQRLLVQPYHQPQTEDRLGTARQDHKRVGLARNVRDSAGKPANASKSSSLRRHALV